MSTRHDMKVLCIGHASYDITLPIAGYPVENTKNAVSGKVECGGGPASNAAYLLAKWGLETTFAGVVGDDFYGACIRAEFDHIGIDSRYLKVSEVGKTSSSYIIANTETGTRTILTARDETLGKLEEDISDSYDVILVDGEELEVSKQVLLRNKGAISIMDVGKMREATEVLGPLVTYFVCSKDFAEKTCGKAVTIDSLEEVYDLLKAKYQTNIVITLESAGCYTKVDGKGLLVPSLTVKAVDSTGAGDIFHGAFTYFISQGYSLKDSLVLANVAGALSVTKIGSRHSIPTLEEVLDEAKRHALLP